MADWLHKDREWLTSNNYQHPEGGWLNVGDDEEAVLMAFEDWLDWQCEGGWEVIKIHRDLKARSIWCVFRCKR